MSKVNRTLMIGDDVVEVASDNLPAAAANAKGAVKKGTSVLCRPMQNGKTIDEDFSFNEQVRSLRASGALQNNKFALVFDLNGSEAEFEHYGDLQRPHEYTTGQTVTLDLSDTQNIPYRDGYDFIGFALTENAQSPDYPYDENDPQTYTLTFVDDDIVLYAVWEIATYTLTYSLGSYGQGSVPAAQTATEGEGLTVSFSPAPTVNDGSGRVFVGWSRNDGQNSYEDAQYRNEDGYDNITLYEDVTIYPVFCALRTLTYALGNDATGTVPSAETAYNGETVLVNFNPSVTCISDPTKVFIGWAYSDESSSTDFSTDGDTEIFMDSNYTLYPVFGQAQQGTAVFEVVNNSSYSVTVNQGGVILGTVSSNDSDTFNLTNLNTNIEITCNDYVDGVYTGTYKGTSYSGEGLGYDSKNSAIQDPDDNHYWTFEDGDMGTLTVRDPH